MAARNIIFSDDTLFQETGTSFVTKKSFRVVSDSVAPATSWRAVFSLRNAGTAGQASCRVTVGSDVSTIVTTTVVTETILSITFTNTNPTNTLLTAKFDIKVDVAGPIAEIKYTDLYALLT